MAWNTGNLSHKADFSTPQKIGPVFIKHNSRPGNSATMIHLSNHEVIVSLIRCVSNEAYNSNWGCARRKNPLNIIVTDQDNHVIYPLKEFIMEPAGMWYYMPLVDAV